MSVTPKMPTPVQVGGVTDKQFTITWSDGHQSTYSWQNLRINCPCAACKGEFGYRPPRLTAQNIPRAIRALSIGRVGAYALRFSWSDNHDTGLYTFNYLRNELCECEECVRNRTTQASTPE